MATKKYDEDFKKMIVELYENKKPVCEIKREYGIPEATLYRWIKEYSAPELFSSPIYNILFFTSIVIDIFNSSNNFITSYKLFFIISNTFLNFILFLHCLFFLAFF